MKSHIAESILIIF